MHKEVLAGRNQDLPAPTAHQIQEGARRGHGGMCALIVPYHCSKAVCSSRVLLQGDVSAGLSTRRTDPRRTTFAAGTDRAGTKPR